jgi:predicted O-methyltransferase YrrM
MYPKILQKFDTFMVKTVYRYANRRWYGNPLIKTIKAEKEEYLRLWELAKSESFPEIDALETTLGFAVNKEFLHELALHTQVVIKKSKINYQHGRVLYSLLSKYISDTHIDSCNIIETGTALGFSSLCMAKALHDRHANGKILTFDVLPHNKKIYWNCIDDHEGKKTRAELLTGYSDLCERYIVYHQGNSITEMNKTDMTRIRFAFLDGGHEYRHVKTELEHIMPYQLPGDMIVFDDYSTDRFPGIVNAANEMCSIHNYHRKTIVVEGNRIIMIAKKNSNL